MLYSDHGFPTVVRHRGYKAGSRVSIVGGSIHDVLTSTTRQSGVSTEKERGRDRVLYGMYGSEYNFRSELENKMKKTKISEVGMT